MHPAQANVPKLAITGPAVTGGCAKHSERHRLTTTVSGMEYNGPFEKVGCGAGRAVMDKDEADAGCHSSWTNELKDGET